MRMMGFRPESELLLCCARTYVDLERAARIKALLQKDLDWNYLLRMGIRLGVMPLLYQSLNTTCPDGVPSTTLVQLRSEFLENALNNFLLTEELLKLLTLFEVHGIRAVPYKGPALAASVYGNI